MGHSNTYIKNQIIDTLSWWKNKLKICTIQHLTKCPSENSWSIGQLFLHLTHETNYYISEINTCLATSENREMSMTLAAQDMFTNNSFPDIKIKGDSELSSNIEQPKSISKLMEEWSLLEEKLIDLENKIAISQTYGKSKHPGLGYFSASEWLQFAEMHMRHHQKQWQRLDLFLTELSE